MEGTCTPCECFMEGSTSPRCDQRGRCRCRGSIFGDKCDKCNVSQSYLTDHVFILPSAHLVTFLPNLFKNKSIYCSRSTLDYLTENPNSRSLSPKYSLILRPSKLTVLITLSREDMYQEENVNRVSVLS